MKGKLLKPYSIDMTRTLCAGSEVEIVDGYCACNGYMYRIELSDGTQRIINSQDIQVTDHKPYVDWRKVRIQAAIAAMQGICGSKMFWQYTENDIAKKSVYYADELIEELKKTM